MNTFVFIRQGSGYNVLVPGSNQFCKIHETQKCAQKRITVVGKTAILTE